MVKKTGTQSRATKREIEVERELILHREDEYDRVRFESKKDNDLFVLDRIADAKVLRHISSEKLPYKGMKNFISEMERFMITKFLSNHGTESAVKLAKLHSDHSKKSLEASNVYNLWADDDIPPDEKERKRLISDISGVPTLSGVAPTKVKPNIKYRPRKFIEKSIQVVVAEPGQSFHPDEEQHQDTIGEALDIELHRNEIFEYRKVPIGNEGMKPETLKVLLGSSDDESNTDDINTVAQMRYKKRNIKLTHTQRNKRKRATARDTERREQKRRKQLLNSILDAKQLNKELRKKDEMQKSKRERLREIKKELKSKPLGIQDRRKLIDRDPINAMCLPVALTKEIKYTGGSLRTMIPKGNLLSDRVESMILRNMHNSKTLNRKKIIQGKKRKFLGEKMRMELLDH